MIRLIVACLVWSTPLAADVLVAARTIPAQSVIGPSDLVLARLDSPGGVDDPALLIGMEARVALYAGRPVTPGDVGLPAIVDRNEIIPLIYNAGGLHISTEGRALGRAGAGEVIRVLNLTSRNTVTAKIGQDGAGYVSR